MSSPHPTQAAFNKAIREFRAGLKDPALYSQILATTSIDQVYDLTDELQKVQGKGGHLSNLARIQRYLDRIQAYTGVIDTFVQAKPDILALIWGPIKLLIQCASTLTKSLNALLQTIEEIGDLLPEFDHAAKLFGNKRHINEALALLFQDILDFYLVALKFFGMQRLKFFYESFWPKKKEEIERVIGRMKEHIDFLRNEVRLEDIQEAYDARQFQIESFAKLDEENRKQEYAALETAMAPTFYGKKFDFLCGRVCEGTEDWLVNDVDFRKWLQVTQDSAKLIWLYGIPGAGKTYLAACAIQASIAVGYTLFLFLSHEHPDKSVISLFHSLIFQLSRKDSKLQDMVRYTNRDPLEFDLPSTVRLFTNMLRGAGPVRIVVDGLDEINEVERVHFLRQMLKVSSDCNEVRVLIGSRPEADIKALLEKTSKPIRVDNRNTASIHAFAMSQFREWSQSRYLSPEDSTEVAELIGNLAHQAQGMFLYAHLVLKSLVFLHSVSEVKQDLKVLPTSLHDAYGRIFTRINEGLPNQSVRDKARKALGWIGYSPVPLTVRELDQALAIRIGDLDQDVTGISGLSLDRLCGPIVEEVDGELHLVHFTAKEYIFSPMIKDSLDPAQCVLSLAKCCITYLSQQHHALGIDDSLFQDNVVRGVYRLHHFASNNWSLLVEYYLKMTPTAEDNTELTQLIANIDLLTTRTNEYYLESEERSDPRSLEALQSKSSNNAYELVCNELEFHRQASTRLYELEKGDWQDADPLLVRHITASFHATLDRLTCLPSGHRDRCFCEAIHHHYGRPFKCNFVGCAYQRVGFETFKERREHSKVHDRPWTCEVVNCEYHEIGFISRQMRDHHLDRAHKVDKPSESITGAAENEDEKVALLKALIQANKFVEDSAAKDVFDGLNHNDQQRVLEEAASRGTFELMELLCPDVHCGSFRMFGNPFSSLITAALSSQNRETLKWIQVASHKVLESSGGGIVGIWRMLLSSDDPEHSYQCVEHWLYRVFIEPRRLQPSCFTNCYVEATENDHLKESLLIKVWDKCGIPMPEPTKYWSRTLCVVARTTCSLKLASWLLEHGAKVNHVKAAMAGPPLLLAAKKDRLEAARLMRFLLYQGADPECTNRDPKATRRTVSTMKGPKGLHKWLGISWEELVEEARKARENNDNPLVPIE
ncbi:hypothetical protein NM208_g4030 [Fusarium decemcellulare]|uniref:Uncharacterized protein n=2 Tax=Fusarium decemcellulare TaxID=57161 RepID=A0ACC1SM09_9HYPO|nr:hypothetical protein NM208_g4281 [Fusarium decemcellulare]KAJ3542551.1 hypothetical protein NM208_g4030 [Fusarium decemcellulare]